MNKKRMKELKEELFHILFVLQINKNTEEDINKLKQRKKEIESEIKQLLFEENNKKEGKKL